MNFPSTQLNAFQSVKLKQANKEIEELKSKRAILKRCVRDVKSLVSNILEAHDSILTISVCRHLDDKLHPAFTLLNRIEGFSEVLVPPKQGGEAEKVQNTKAGETQTKTNRRLMWLHVQQGKKQWVMLMKNKKTKKIN